MIQVDDARQNSIIILAGTNGQITEDHIRKVLEHFRPGDLLVAQNEISNVDTLIRLGAEKGMHIALNPSPYDRNLEAVDYSKLDWLLVNEIEAEQISGEKEPEKAWEKLHGQYPELSVLITLGSRGSIAYRVAEDSVETHYEEAARVKAVDTTAAGDTYTGYFIAGLTEGKPLCTCMREASRAAAIAVTRPGAAGSIPWRKELG